MSNLVDSLATAYIDAINAGNAQALVATFRGDAIVDDIGREIAGSAAIKEWAEREIFGVNVTLDVIDRVIHAESATLTVKVDGTFDRTGLPDPLVMTHQIAMDDGKIARLACRLAS